MPRRAAALVPLLALVGACAGGGAVAAPPPPVPPPATTTVPAAPVPPPVSDETRFLRDLRTTPRVDVALGDRAVVALGRSACEGFARGEDFATIAGRTASASALGERDTRALVRAAGLFLCPGDVTDLPALDAPPSTAPPPPPPVPAPAGTWTYRVTGPATALITYQASGGNVSQVNGAQLPWSTTVEDPGVAGMAFAHVSAQNAGGGTISCQIIGPAGTVVAENSSQGDFAIVTCQG